MPRIPLPDPAQLTPSQQRVYDAIVSGPRGQIVGPLRAVLLVPELADRWQSFGEHVRYKTSLPSRVSELAIIVVARRWNSQIEWQIHAQAALAAGVPAEIISAVRVGEGPEFAHDEDADIYEYARQLVSYGDVGDALHAKVCRRWGAPGVVELTAIIGYYTMVSMMLNAQAIPPLAGPEPPLVPVPGQDALTLSHLSPARRAAPLAAD
jgi:4-carboxymuconolactone decarboxylase